MTSCGVQRKRFLKLFQEQKCLTLEALGKSLDYSVRSIQRLLKKTGYYSSFTHNSKWYVLRETPSFSETGLWFHNEIGFSKHGNLNRTIYYFVNQSSQGLTAKEISEIITIACHPVLTVMHKKGMIDRIKTRRGFVYISQEKRIKERQEHLIAQSKKRPFPSDSDAVRILVELIKNPSYTAEDLSSSLGDEITCETESITRLLQHHELEKKTRKRWKKFS